jgi:hypothetical protein
MVGGTQESRDKPKLELLNKGLGLGTIEFLRSAWFPVVGNFNHLLPEWEVQDFSNGYRYLDLAYMPGGSKGGIEIQGYGPHARDLDVRRFKDLCRRHCSLSLDGWTFLPIAYPSITDEPKQCQQLVLSFIGGLGLAPRRSVPKTLSPTALDPSAPPKHKNHVQQTWFVTNLKLGGF